MLRFGKTRRGRSLQRATGRQFGRESARQCWREGIGTAISRRSAAGLAAERRRGDPRHWRKVRRESRDRNGLDDGPYLQQPRPLGIRSQTVPLLRLRQRQQPVRLWLVAL